MRKRRCGTRSWQLGSPTRATMNLPNSNAETQRSNAKRRRSNTTAPHSLNAAGSNDWRPYGSVRKSRASYSQRYKAGR